MRKMHEFKIPDNRKTDGAFIQLVYSEDGYFYNPKELTLMESLKLGDLVLIDIYNPEDDFHNYAVGFVEDEGYHEVIIAPLGSVTIRNQDTNDERVFYISLQTRDFSGSVMNQYLEQIDGVVIDTEVNIYKL